MTSSPSSKAPAWFSTLIGEGLATLYLLNLEGCPAADSTSPMASIWVNTLWNTTRRDWHMEADTPCIRAAFATLAGTCHRWPAPAKFWEVLPSRASSEQTALPARIFSMEERRENIRKLREIGEKLLGGKAEDAAS